MNFSEICNEVVTITKRPDLVAETELAVRKATLKMHQLEHFPLDKVEVTKVLSPASNRFALSLEAFPRFRGIQYIRDYTDDRLGKFFTQIEPDDVLDMYNVEKQDTWYLAGNQLKFSAYAPVNKLIILYSTLPPVTLSEYGSWIAERVPYAIIDEAACTIFKMIGYEEAHQRYAALSAENQMQLKSNFLTGACV